MAQKGSSPEKISHQTTLAFLIFMFMTTMPTTTYAFGVKLIPIDSIDSAYFPKNLTTEEWHNRLFEISKRRVQLLHLRSITNSTEALMEPGLNKLQSEIWRNTSSYYVTQFSIGSQPYSPYMMVDTGSSWTWIQCDGCTHCFPIQIGSFMPSKSSSYHSVRCSDPRCFTRRCNGQKCWYRTEYFKSSSEGLVSLDQFGFTGVKLPNILFGCGLNNQNMDFAEKEGQGNKIAGIFGLGANSHSFLKQQAAVTLSRFSYCLPPLYKPPSTHTFLRFGQDADFSGDLASKAQTTQLVPNQHTYYVRNVLGISIDRKQLKIDQTLFRLKPNGKGGFVVDSGSPLTSLVEPAYDVVKKEMINYFKQHNGLDPSPKYPHQLCFAIPSGKRIILPVMTYHFEGANLVVPQLNTFIGDGNDHVCMMIRSLTTDLQVSLLGASQQADHRFLFDAQNWKMSFAPVSCDNN